MSALLHLTATIRDWKGVSAVTPSSSFVVRRLEKHIDFGRAKVVLEYGPGSGVITRPLLDQLRGDARLIAIELNEKFAGHLERSIADRRCRVVHEDAERVGEILNRAGLPAADFIVSGIPFFWLPERTRDAIVSASWQALRPGGSFIALQMFQVPRRCLRKHLERYFREVSSEIEYLNLPPLRILRAVK